MTEIVHNLSGVFRGGRILGWVERNRGNLGQISDEELKKLEQLSPTFARDTKDMEQVERNQIITLALADADEFPISATQYELISANSQILRRKTI